ncbi:hypothetical protein Ancab_034231 [Ancistrocladus abbreviatus]
MKLTQKFLPTAGHPGAELVVDLLCTKLMFRVDLLSFITLDFTSYSIDGNFLNWFFGFAPTLPGCCPLHGRQNLKEVFCGLFAGHEDAYAEDDICLSSSSFSYDFFAIGNPCFAVWFFLFCTLPKLNGTNVVLIALICESACDYLYSEVKYVVNLSVASLNAGFKLLIWTGLDDSSLKEHTIDFPHLGTQNGRISMALKFPDLLPGNHVSVVLDLCEVFYCAVSVGYVLFMKVDSILLKYNHLKPFNSGYNDELYAVSDSYFFPHCLAYERGCYSIMSWYLSLERGKFWFPAQVYNRENGHARFMLSCYVAELCYNSRTNTFQARYLQLWRHTMEEHIPWDRLRAPPVDTPAYVLHVSDCLDDLKRGDHFEFQWRRNKDYPCGWWYGVVGHLESCDRNESSCNRHNSAHDLLLLADTVLLEFNQHDPDSRWRTVNRKNHCEEENAAHGFYGGIRKLYNEEEISAWKSICPTKVLD